MRGGCRSDRNLEIQQEFDLIDEILSYIRFHHVTVGPGFSRLLFHLLSIMHRKHNNLGFGRHSADFRRAFQAVHDRHADIEDNDVGMHFPDLLDGFLAVRSFSADTEIAFLGENAAYTAADKFVIVDHEDAKFSG
jgi:hypothetical protein